MTTALTMNNRSVPSDIGSSMQRVEDESLLRGDARFIDDINIPGQCFAVFVRSPHANAKVLSISTDAASAAPGVVGIFSARDLQAHEFGSLHAASTLTGADGAPIKNPIRMALVSHARYVGDGIAMLVAKTAAQAEHAAELIEVEYAVERSVVDSQKALEEGAVHVWPELGTNVALDWSGQHENEVAAAFRSASHVARVTVTNNRVMVTALEPRGAVAEYDAETSRITLWTPTQGGTAIQSGLVRAGIVKASSEVRVITPHVGGGFGIKNGIYPEQILIAWAARKLRIPVKWYASRTDAFLNDYHARDHIMTAELALDSDANFLAIRCDVVSNMGAYLTDAGPIIPTLGGPRMLANVYRTPLAHARSRCVFTNTTPIAAFRGAGKPEFAHLVEAVVDQAALDLKLDRTEIRRRNLISPGTLPWRTPTGLEYDSGHFESHLDEALLLSQYETKETRRQQALADGVLLGFGVSLYTEPDGYKDNRVDMSFDPNGRLTVITSAQTNGQNHATAYTQIAHTLLGVDADYIQVIEGDTDRMGLGSGSGGSRSATVTGAAMHYAGLVLIDKAKRIAAHAFETSVDDIDFDHGTFSVAGTDRRLDWPKVAAIASKPASLPSDIQPGLQAQHHYDAPVYCYPCGCHICEVAIDIDTGTTTVLRYLSHSDFGTIINPMLVEGQLHGGIAQGYGQVLQEHTVYDDDSGQLFSGSFMDYCIPKARDMPDYETSFANTRCLTNPLGTKGCGESGPTASLPALSSAVHDALRDYDTTNLKMPYTAERIWRILQSG